MLATEDVHLLENINHHSHDYYAGSLCTVTELRRHQTICDFYWLIYYLSTLFLSLLVGFYFVTVGF